jgi:hypothetical protein
MVNYLLDGSVALSSLSLRSVLRPSGFICEKTSILGVYILLHTEDENGLYIPVVLRLNLILITAPFICTESGLTCRSS